MRRWVHINAGSHSVAVNDPYKGMKLVRASGDPARRRHSIQIEVNRKLYMDETTREPNAGYAALRETFDALSDHLAGYVATLPEGQPA